MKKKCKGFPAVFVIIVLAMVLFACDNGTTPSEPYNYNIGDTGPAGGIIFYVSETGFTVEGKGTCHYLEAVPDNQKTFTWWGDEGTLVDEITTFAESINEEASWIGNGRKDTLLIVEHMERKGITGTAAQFCDALNTGGKDDWYLPSLGELNEMYKQMVFLPEMFDGYFLSSSQSDAEYVWEKFFDGSSGDLFLVEKDNADDVRAIRAF